MNFIYDADGNTTSDAPFASRMVLRGGTNTYTWNARNELVSISGSVAASFQYDAFGRRLSKTINSATTNFLYDGMNPVEELSGTTVAATMLTGLRVHEYFQRTDASGASDYLSDALGGTVALASPAGALATQYTYEPFGNTTSAGPASANPFQFTARANDGTGLYFYRARYYDPTTGRFLSEDPIRFAGGTNLYRYSDGDPVDETDPFGLTDIEITVARDTSTANSTTDTLSASAGELGSVNNLYSLEPPLRGPGPVAIPPGDYPAHWRTDSGPGLNHQAVELDPLPNGQTNIQIHPGNFPYDTRGCILPGTGRRRDQVTNSRKATKAINDLVNKVLTHDKETGGKTNFTVDVINSFQ
jgi:RHS repeat-associated protein